FFVTETGCDTRSLLPPNGEQLFRLLDRQHPPHYGVHQAEDRRVRSNTQRQRQSHRRRECRALDEHADRICYVLSQATGSLDLTIDTAQTNSVPPESYSS